MNLVKKLAGAALAASLLACALPSAQAGTEMSDSKDMKGVTPPECGQSDWSLEASSGVQWSNVRAGTYRGYTVEPVELTALLKVDDVSLDNFAGGIFRGYTQFLFRGQYDFISMGPENRYAGLLVGPRYNFVQPGWKIVPFVEGTVGVGFADARAQENGLGQDFNFSFEVAAGAKYNINCNWYVSLAAQYQHVSNAGLSAPLKNNPLDLCGPVVSVGYNF